MINKVSNFSNLNSILSTQPQKDKTEIKTEKVSRVEEIKNAIANGSYKIDLDKTAKALAKTLL